MEGSQAFEAGQVAAKKRTAEELAVEHLQKGAEAAYQTRKRPSEVVDFAEPVSGEFERPKTEGEQMAAEAREAAEAQAAVNQLAQIEQSLAAIDRDVTVLEAANKREQGLREAAQVRLDQVEEGKKPLIREIIDGYDKAIAERTAHIKSLRVEGEGLEKFKAALDA